MSVAQLRQQQTSGFRHLRFQPQLEQAYRSNRDQALRERCRTVTASALILMLLYMLLDLAMLPPELAHQTVAVRALFSCPVIAGVWWLSYRALTPDTFVRCYAGAYLGGGLSVVGIIALARTASFPMPYDGILLMLMFGYVVMGLPFRTVSVTSVLIVAAYLSMESAFGTAHHALLINGFFIATANVIGMVGSWLSEYHQRAHFLDQQMLEASRREAEQESARKTHLITVASHDLRQPLNVIGLMLENLSTADLAPSLTPLVSRLKASVTHLNSLLASVLDISRLQEGMVSPQPAVLAPESMLRQVQDAVSDDADERGITLVINPCPPAVGVYADPQLLQRILLNLVMNSLEHSQAQTIRMSVELHQQQLRFGVSDDGRGIDEATLAHVFDPFYQADEQPRDNAGLGLGLAIVKELSELMDGSCGVYSRPQAGSHFWVDLPITAAALPATTLVRDAAHQPDSGQLLVVEDHDEARYWVCRTLNGWGYQTVDFARPEQAIAHCETAGIDVLISDLHLPTMSGLALFERLARDERFQGGVIMTADTSTPQAYDPDRRIWTLHKPIAPLRLRAAILQLTRPVPAGSPHPTTG